MQTEIQVEGVSAHEVKFALEREVTLVDVRVPSEFAKAHIPGAKNVPVYQSIRGWTPWKILRRTGFALFGVFNATEPNVNFTAELASAVGGDPATQVILVCNSKGDMSRPPPPNNAELWHEVYQSRSLIAAYLATVDGFTNISVLRTGFKAWQRDGRPVAKLS
ncbi:Rhodanese-like protein [Coccomyxa subellipsoidea C-169]|uniref:Rhodanese-like protein n=1 Tax=Coccomyxa subellipsoidea (strain C-169) TaxID=574566 RepID=I0Z0I9_COCSC|nr:Rhodanese-like protein [Coccomyxa subellipsoidea C-169]EIE24158.1 Rhodanese-like protein [Coccomyxa subellipsoidea C-169]|eukprot:XP_005648702.1 Rhodanese-like protein [Coccomyxa subellipsoidea C-169]